MYKRQALACEALRSRGLDCASLVIGAWPAEPDLAARCNLEDLPAYSGVPVTGRLPEGAGALGREAFLTMARAAMTELEVHA